MAMTLRLSDDLDQRVAAYADQVGLSKQQVVVEALEQHLERINHSNEVRSAVNRVVKRDAELLDRLADA